MTTNRLVKRPLDCYCFPKTVLVVPAWALPVLRRVRRVPSYSYSQAVPNLVDAYLWWLQRSLSCL